MVTIRCAQEKMFQDMDRHGVCLNRARTDAAHLRKKHFYDAVRGGPERPGYLPVRLLRIMSALCLAPGLICQI